MDVDAKEDKEERVSSPAPASLEAVEVTPNSKRDRQEEVAGYNEGHDNATPTPPPQPKRKRFFAKDENEETIEHEIREELVASTSVNGNDTLQKPKGREASIVEIVDDSDEDTNVLPIASTSKAPKSQDRTPKPRVPRNGKEFKDERYFGSKADRKAAIYITMLY